MTLIIIIILLPLAHDSQWLRTYLKNYKTLGASRLVPNKLLLSLLLLHVLYSIRLFVHYFTISDKLTTTPFEHFDKSTTGCDTNSNFRIVDSIDLFRSTARLGQKMQL